MTRWLAETGGTRGADYQQAFQERAAAGEYLHGEADAVGRLRPAPARVLDAGCGTGRIAVELDRRGYRVTGVDNDTSMLDQARALAPGLDWLDEDLLAVELGPVHDVVLLAGNVMIFLDPGTEAAVVARMAAHLRPGGLLVAGFRLGGAGLFTDDPDAPAPRRPRPGPRLLRRALRRGRAVPPGALGHLGGRAVRRRRLRRHRAQPSVLTGPGPDPRHCRPAPPRRMIHASGQDRTARP